METNEKELKPEESLQIIENMIQRTKSNLHDSSFYFLLWGWVILIGLVGQLIIKYFTSYPKPYIMWLVVIPGMIASAVYGYRHGKKNSSITHLDKVNGMVWFSFFVSYVLILVLMKEINYKADLVIYLLAGNATFLTGIIIKFKPLVLGGIVFWIGTLCYLFIPNNYMEFISPLVIIFGYLVPGYLLQSQNKTNA